MALQSLCNQQKCSRKRTECLALSTKTEDKRRDYACAMQIKASNAADSLETDDERTYMKTLELYFNDLTPEAQKKYLEVNGVSDASELNWEINPIAIIEVESIEEE